MPPPKKTESQTRGEFLDLFFFSSPHVWGSVFWGVARIAVHPVDQEHLDHHHLDQEHLDHDHLDQEHLDHDHLDQEHLDHNHLDQEHLDHHHLDQDHPDHNQIMTRSSIPSRPSSILRQVS